MNRRTFLTAAAAAAGFTAYGPGGVGVTLAAEPVAPPPDPFPDGTYALMPLGDSITEGLTDDPANGLNGWRGYLYDDLRIRNELGGRLRMVGSRQTGSRGLFHEGWGGQTIAQVAGHVGVGLAPQFIVVLAGANDVGEANQRTWQQCLADTADLLDRCLAWAPWTRVVLCLQPLMSGWYSHDRTRSTKRQQALNRNLPGLLGSRGGRVVVARTDILSDQMIDRSSGVHPTDVGYRWMSYVIYYALAPWLGEDVGDAERYMTNTVVPGGQPRPLAVL